MSCAPRFLLELLTSYLEKYLLALRCLLASQAIDKNDPRVKEQAARLRETVQPILGSMDTKVKEIIEASL